MLGSREPHWEELESSNAQEGVSSLISCNVELVDYTKIISICLSL